MNNTAKTSDDPAVPTASAKPKEKIIFEIQPLVLPTILNLENLTIVGFAAVIMLAFVGFHLGITELLIIGLIYVLVAIPSFRNIFRAGSTSYVLTNQRLVVFEVNVRNKEQSYPLDRISGVKTKTSGLQRIYRAGDVIVYLKDLRRPVRMLGLRDCKQRAEQIQQAVKKYNASIIEGTIRKA